MAEGYTCDRCGRPQIGLPPHSMNVPLPEGGPVVFSIYARASGHDGPAYLRPELLERDVYDKEFCPRCLYRLLNEVRRTMRDVLGFYPSIGR